MPSLFFKFPSIFFHFVQTLFLPGVLCISDLNRACLRILQRHLHQTWRRHLYHSLPILILLYLGPTTTSHTINLKFKIYSYDTVRLKHISNNISDSNWIGQNYAIIRMCNVLLFLAHLTKPMQSWIVCRCLLLPFQREAALQYPK